MAVDVNEKSVAEYQNLRLEEKAAPKSINEEIGFLLRLMNDAGDMLRLRLRKKKLLKLRVRRTVGKAYSAEEKARMLKEAKAARSPHIYPALVLALNAGMRDREIKNLRWCQIDLERKFLVVGDSKTDAGEGRTIPLNSALETAMVEYSSWYRGRFGELRPEWYVFPFGKPQPADPTRPVTTLKTAWNNLRERAKVTGRWHDSRHTWRAVPATKPSWISLGTSRSRCSSTTAIFAWRRSGWPWSRFSRNSPWNRSSGNTRRQRRINRQRPLLLRILRGSPYKSPYSGWKIKVIGVCGGQLTP